MKTRHRTLITAAGLLGILLAAGPAAARMASGGTTSVYPGAGAGVANFEDDVELGDLSDVELDDDSTAYKIFAGYRAAPSFAIEGGYRNFGEADAGPFSVETEGFDVSAVGLLPVGPVDLFAKIGLIFWDTNAGAGIPDSDGEDLTYGVGGQLNVGSLFFRLESEWFDIDFPEETQMIIGSIGLSF